VLLAEVPLSELRPTCDPASFTFETTAEVTPFVGLIGQDRAIEALKFGLAIEGQGFNICVVGEPGTGRTTAIREHLQLISVRKAPPDEWCYVNNFIDPHRPRAIRLPPGKGIAFQNAMARMVAEAKERIPSTFASDDYINHRDEIVSSVERGRDRLFAALADRARQGGFLLQGNPSGFFLVPLSGVSPMDDSEFSALPPEQREALMEKRDTLMGELREAMKQGASVEMAATARLNELRQQIATTVFDSVLDALFEEYEPFPAVIMYLQEVRREMIDNVDDFLPQAEGPIPGVPAGGRPPTSPLRKYEVNLLVDCSKEQCASVIFESNPTPQRLFGRIEKEAAFGVVTTDFTMIRAGSLHRANGGFLVIDFDDLFQYQVSWNELKRTLRNQELTIEEMGDRLGYVETKTVRPEPIPWTGKIVAIAREGVYRTLFNGDPDFRGIFKVKADFEVDIDRTKEHEDEFAGLMASVTKREGLLPMHRGAVARVIDEALRMAGDHNKLSTRFGDITDIIRESVH
jgi:predicted ATP-dependent protease